MYVLRERQRFLEILGVPVGMPTTKLQVTASELGRAEEIFRDAGVPADAPRVAMVLSVTEPIRQWPLERFGELASALAAEGITPIVLSNPGDEAKVARFQLLSPAVISIETAELRMLLAAIASCGVLVSGDTGPAHMATALGVPRVTIYGPTDPAAWNPGLPTTIIVRDPSALVMRTREWAAAGEHQGITGVSAGQVLQHVRELLRLSGAPSMTKTGNS